MHRGQRESPAQQDSGYLLRRMAQSSRRYHRVFVAQGRGSHHLMDWLRLSISILLVDHSSLLSVAQRGAYFPCIAEDMHHSATSCLCSLRESICCYKSHSERGNSRLRGKHLQCCSSEYGLRRRRTALDHHAATHRGNSRSDSP